METVTDVGEELVALRRSLGLTQGGLAERLGVKRQQVQRWEASAYRSASLERVGRVAEALGWSLQQRVPLPAAGVAVPRVAPPAPPRSRAAAPVRDLGEIVARVRAHAPELRATFGVASVSVFGSFARGEQAPDSDVDLVVEVEDPSMERVSGAERELELILGRRTETGSLAGVGRRVRTAARKDLVRVWPA